VLWTQLTLPDQIRPTEGLDAETRSFIYARISNHKIKYKRM